jgi:hypothetical protein
MNNINNIDILYQDFLRFSTLHSWYKHNPFDGRDFYFYMKKGQQIRHPIDPQVDDKENMNMHWFFTKTPLFIKDNKIHTEDNEILLNTPVPPLLGKVRFGPFLRGDILGYNIIIED